MNRITAAITDRGRQRQQNEDAYLVRHEPGVYIVADGLGGHAAGEVASDLAVEVAGAALVEAAGRPPSPALDALLREAVRAAHHAIRELAAQEPDKAGMGTTLTALVVTADRCTYRIAHVGDSRAYLLRDGRLRQLTTDHTWVEEQVERGLLTREQARAHPHASVLTRALGVLGPDPVVDIVPGRLAPGDLILLCSDGLTGPVTDDDLRAILDRDLPLDALAGRLVEAANLRGGPDNITAVLIRAAAQDPPAAASPPARSTWPAAPAPPDPPSAARPE